MRSQLTRIPVPSLVVQGVADEHASPQHARDLADAISAVELWLVPEAGHMLPQQMPDKFNQRSLAFLETIPAAQGINLDIS
jgi:pimeloyl-ACP methyl ester carboxylesterase